MIVTQITTLRLRKQEICLVLKKTYFSKYKMQKLWYY